MPPTAEVAIRASWLDRASPGIERTRTQYERFAQTVRNASGVMTNALRGVLSWLTSIQGMLATIGVGLGFRELINASRQTSNALQGLSSIARAYNLDQAAVRQGAMDLTRDGLLSIQSASLGLKNLLSTGLSLPQAMELMRGLTEQAIYNRQAHYSLEEAVQAATEGIRNENSILADATGTTRNLFLMYQDYARLLGKSVQDLTRAEKAQAAYIGFLEETRKSQGDLQKVMETSEGKILRFNAAFERTKSVLGDTLLPVLSNILEEIDPILKKTKQWAEANKTVIAQETIAGFEALLAVLTAISGVIRTIHAMLSPIISPLISGIGALMEALSFEEGSFFHKLTKGGILGALGDLNKLKTAGDLIEAIKRSLSSPAPSRAPLEDFLVEPMAISVAQQTGRHPPPDTRDAEEAAERLQKAYKALGLTMQQELIEKLKALDLVQKKHQLTQAQLDAAYASIIETWKKTGTAISALPKPLQEYLTKLQQVEEAEKRRQMQQEQDKARLDDYLDRQNAIFDVASQAGQQEKDLRLQMEQNKVALMEEGLDKRLAMIELERRATLEALAVQEQTIRNQIALVSGTFPELAAKLEDQLKLIEQIREQTNAIFNKQKADAAGEREEIVQFVRIFFRADIQSVKTAKDLVVFELGELTRAIINLGGAAGKTVGFLASTAEAGLTAFAAGGPWAAAAAVGAKVFSKLFSLFKNDEAEKLAEIQKRINAALERRLQLEHQLLDLYGVSGLDRLKTAQEALRAAETEQSAIRRQMGEAATLVEYRRLEAEYLEASNKARQAEIDLIRAEQQARSEASEARNRNLSFLDLQFEFNQTPIRDQIAALMSRIPFYFEEGVEASFEERAALARKILSLHKTALQEENEARLEAEKEALEQRLQMERDLLRERLAASMAIRSQALRLEFQQQFGAARGNVGLQEQVMTQFMARAEDLQRQFDAEIARETARLAAEQEAARQQGSQAQAEINAELLDVAKQLSQMLRLNLFTGTDSSSQLIDLNGPAQQFIDAVGRTIVQLDGLSVSANGIINAFNTAGANISGFNFGTKVPTLSWNSYVSMMRWSDHVPQVAWANMITPINLANYVNPASGLNLANYVTAVDLNSKVTALNWATKVPSLDWTTRVPALDWTTRIPALDWSSRITAVDLSSFVRTTGTVTTGGTTTGRTTIGIASSQVEETAAPTPTTFVFEGDINVNIPAGMDLSKMTPEQLADLTLEAMNVLANRHGYDIKKWPKS